MQTPPSSLGPVFIAGECERHPSPKVQDLGIDMLWGNHGHVTHRLYRNLRDHAPYAFGFDDVVVHEKGVQCNIEYQPYLARKTDAGTFLPLSAYLQALYAHKLVDRNIFVVLAELDRLLPPDRRLTAKDTLNFCHSLGKAAPLPPEPPVEPSTGLLVPDLEIQGYRLAKSIPEEGRALLEIGWLPKPGARLFFTGILELRPTQDGITGQWMLPGPSGVNHLLRRELQQLCAGPSTCLTSVGQKYCLKGVKPLPQAANATKQISAWKPEPTTSASAASSSSHSRQRNKLN